MLAVRRIEVLLHALSSDTGVKDGETATNMAEQLYSTNPYPVNLELLALAVAATGDFDKATEKMQEAVAAERRYSNAANIERMEQYLFLLQKHQLPHLDWHEEVAHMLPPPTNGLTVFRDYPDAKPI